MTIDAAVGDRLGELLAAAAPGHYRGGPPLAGAVALERFQDTTGVRELIDLVCARTGTVDRTGTVERDAAGFSLFYGAAGALLGPAAALLLDPARPALAVDPARTLLGLDHEGLVDAVWTGWRPVGLLDAGRDVGGGPVPEVRDWLGPQLAATVEAFRPHLRVGPRGFAAAAGSTLAALAERIGRSTGRVGPAREVVAGLVAGLYVRGRPLLRPPRYVPVPLGPGRCTAPTPTVCCRFYRLAGAEAFCAGCPRQPEPARTASLHEYLDRTLRPAVDDLPVLP